VKTETRVLARHKDDNGNIYKIFHITHFSSRYAKFHIYWTREYKQCGDIIDMWKGLNMLGVWNRQIVATGTMLKSVIQTMYRDNAPPNDGTFKMYAFKRNTMRSEDD